MQAIATIQVQNERVRVIEYRFAPGAETGHHVHGHDYVVVPMPSGILRLVSAEGTRDARLEHGVSYTRRAGVTHNVINPNPFEFVFIEIELLESPDAPAG